jgi:hypothetical protein
MEEEMRFVLVLRLAVFAGISASLIGSGAPAFAAEDHAAELAAIKAAAEKYRDIEVAKAEGYITPDNHCVDAAAEELPAELGAMGIHYIRPDLLKITGTSPRVNGDSTHTDFMQPAILIYEPQANGSMELVAVENLVFKKAWEAAGNGGPPVFQGRQWDHMADDPSTPGDEAHGFEPHWDQHVWVFRDNPKGVLEPFNTAVTCEHHKAGGHSKH